jgi:hypothetical protein
LSRSSAEATGARIGKFKPPKPTLAEGISDLIQLFKTDFVKESFQKGVKKSFVDTGTLPQATTDEFTQYFQRNFSGTMKIEPTGTAASPTNVGAEIAEGLDAFLDAEPESDEDVDEDEDS